MKELKHTNGSWSINDDRYEGEPYRIIVFSENTQQRIALCLDGVDPIYPSRPIAMANAKLIAAAPELLEACIMASNLNRFAREHIDDEFFIKLNQAIKKATA